jgi:hypothetical protein
MSRRREFSKPIAREIMKRCERPTGWQCEACGLIVSSGEIDHVIAEALIVDKTKKLTAAEGQFLCWPCHQGPDGKTPKDKAAIAKAVRVEANRLGTATPPKAKIKSAPKPEKSHKPAVVDRGSLYARYGQANEER